MQRILGLFATLSLLWVATVGCNQFHGGDSASSGGDQSNVAIIDLDAIARQLGYDSQMAGAIQQQKTSLEKQLGVIKASFEESLTKTKGQFGENPTQEQTRQFAQTQRAAAVKWNQEQQKASKLLNHYSAQLIQQFRGSVKITARQVAAEKGLSVILTKNDSVVFDYDMTVDITDAVVQRMRSEQSGPAPAPSEPQETRPAAESAAAESPAADYVRR
ncbi:MAG TPA: OmpH family outer membrane protein [Thermoguttaceae bacterium]|nr:OmpH family outer membrane protein [Thermoguttaceae bacterium]